MEKLDGDRWNEREKLRAISPALNAEKIRVPVLIGHGTEDSRVRVKQATAMVDALEEAGVEVEKYIYTGEVHGFLDECNRIDFYAKLAAFFDRHLVSVRPPPTAPARK